MVEIGGKIVFGTSRINRGHEVFHNFQAAAANGTDLWHALFAARTISSICPPTYTKKRSDLNYL